MTWRKKGKKNVPIVPISEEEVNAIEEKVQDLVKTQLPLGRVKKIVRLNPDVEMLNAEALQMMTKSAELFIKELSNAANQNAFAEKRKTIQPKDIDKAIKNMWEFAFLEDALDGWPKMQPKKRKPNSSQDETVAEETIVEEEEHEEEHDDDDVVEASDDVAEEEELPETVPEDDDQPPPQSMKDSFAEQF
ncbi:unnamed protein product [Caenorhabditis nigoni]